MKIVGFSGSHRKEGATAWVLGQILEGAEEKGASTELWCSGDLAINPCRGCLGCVRSGRCAVDDDMQELYLRLGQADALVLGSPVYMGQMSAQAKAFTDRLFAFISPRFSPRHRPDRAGKKLVLVFTQGNPDAGMFKEYFDYCGRMFGLLGFDVRGTFVVPGTREGDARGREGLSGAMRGIGSSLAV